MIAELEDTVLSQNTLLEASESKIGMKTYEISSLIQQLKDSGELINALNVEVTLARDENITLSGKVSEAESQRDSLAKLLQDMEVKSGEREALIQEIESEFTNSCSFIALLEEKISNQKSLLEASENEIRTKTDDISRLMVEVKECDEVINALHANVTSFEGDLATLRIHASNIESQRNSFLKLLSDKETTNDVMSEPKWKM